LFCLCSPLLFCEAKRGGLSSIFLLYYFPIYGEKPRFAGKEAGGGAIAIFLCYYFHTYEKKTNSAMNGASDVDTLQKDNPLCRYAAFPLFKGQ
jgi:hypothetical protein